MTRNKRTRIYISAVWASAFLFVAAAGGAQQPEWRLVRPSNTGIPGDYCHTIYIDAQDRPWICGYVTFWEEGGAAYPEGNGWVTISNADYPVIASPRFNDIVEDLNGHLWIGTNDGLLRMNQSSGPASLVRFDTLNTPMPGNQIVGLDVAPDGTIWIADQEFGGSAAGGLVRYEPDTDTWTAWTTASGLPWGDDWPGWNWVDFVATTPDLDGGYTVWFGSSEMGMSTYKDGVFTWYGDTSPTPGDPTPAGLASNDPVDELGNIWMTTDQGIARRSPDGSYTLVPNPAGLTTEISRVYAVSGGRAVVLTYYSDVFLWDGSWSHLGNWGGSHSYAFAEDSLGDFWVGGIGGAAKYGNGIWQRYRLTNTGMIGFFIDAVAFAPNGDVAMNGNAGAGVGGFDILHSDGSWTNANDATYGLGLPWDLGADDCTSVCYRANGNLLFTPYSHGLYEYDGQQYEQLIPDFYGIGGVLEDSLGRIWATRGNGLDFIDEEGDWTSFFPGDSPLTGGDTGSLKVDPLDPGYIWCVTPFAVVHTDGVDWSVYERTMFGYPSPTDGNILRCVAPAMDGTVWFGVAGAGNGGLFHFDPVSGDYSKFSPAGGDPMPSDDVEVVDIAPDGTVWFNTFDLTYPYPGGVTQTDGQSWTTYSQGSSSLPHNQVTDIRSRTVPGGYEVWIATASEAIAVVTISTTPVAGDIDGDGVVDMNDIPLFTGVLIGTDTEPTHVAAADMNSDGAANGDDGQPFVDALLGP